MSTRREALSLLGVAPFGVSSAPEGPEIVPATGGGIRVLIRRDSRQGWVVALPMMENFRLGHEVMWKWAPLAEYLSQLEGETA